LTPLVYELYNVVGPKFQQLPDLDTFQVRLLPSGMIPHPRRGNPKHLRHLLDGEQLNFQFRSHGHRVGHQRHYTRINSAFSGGFRNFACQIDSGSGTALCVSNFNITSHSRFVQYEQIGLIRLMLLSFHF
jgi:hypothetical protein